MSNLNNIGVKFGTVDVSFILDSQKQSFSIETEALSKKFLPFLLELREDKLIKDLEFQFNDIVERY